jgi:uncharacterized membrane protein
MARVGEFCTANIARLLLTVFIGIGLLLLVGAWFFYSPAKGSSIVQPTHAAPQKAPPQ